MTEQQEARKGFAFEADGMKLFMIDTKQNN
jgi:hypothetical protein